jgi:hypothetical protein
MTRDAAADTRGRKTGQPVAGLRERWRDEARELGWTAARLIEGLTVPAHRHQADSAVTVAQVLDQLSTVGSTWTRADVMRAVCDLASPLPGISGAQWAAALDRVTGEVLGQCVNLDPDNTATRRASDGRSVWLEPTTPHYTSPTVLAEEERILTWALDAQIPEPAPSATVDRDGLDVLQGDAAAAVAGTDRLVVVVGPAGTGKTTMLRAAVDDLRRHGRAVFGVAPTAKAAHVLAGQTSMDTDTVAKLLHEWTRRDRLPDRRYQLPVGTSLVVDETGMLGTSSLHHLIRLAEHVDWRLVLVGDPRQLQAVGRGGLFAELVATSHTHELVRIHRFTHPWEAATSLQLRAGDCDALDAYQGHGRIHAGRLEDHLTGIARDWLTLTATGQTVAVTASSNQHVDTLNKTIQHARLHAGHLDPATAVPIAGGECAHVGEIVVTRRNDRQLTTSGGEIVRNRDRWMVRATDRDGGLTVERLDGRSNVTLPAEYVAHHVRLGYAATEHGHQGDTVDIGIALTSLATTHRGLYVATTRGRNDNRIHVITETNDPSEAREILEGVLAYDRADIPAVTQRRHLAQSDSPPEASRPELLAPDWLPTWRQQLADRRKQLTNDLDDHQTRRAARRRELDDLQPALDAARRAWEPYARPIDSLQRELDSVLRPDLWRANHEARTAGLGHRRSAQRHAVDAAEAVQQAEAAIAAICAEGAPQKQQLDRLYIREGEVRAMTIGPDRLDAHLRQQIAELDQVLDATDTYAAWLDGQPTPSARLAHAVDTLSLVARHASAFARHPNEINQAQWYQLLDLAPDDLHRQADRRRHEPAIGLGH